MGGSQDAARQSAFATQSQMSQEQFGIGKSALEPALGYLSELYGKGGTDLTGKFSNIQTDILESTSRPLMGGFQGAAGQLTSTSGAQAIGLGSNQLEKGGATLDQMNRIRSMLSGQGLQTTNLAQNAAGLRTQAIGLMDKNPTMSTISGVAGLASSLYGAGKQAGYFGSSPQVPQAWSAQQLVGPYYGGS